MNKTFTAIPELDNSLTFIMSLAHKQYRALATQRLQQEFDITLEMVGAMRVLAHMGCIPQQQLADVLKRDRSVTKRLVDNCIKRGLIIAGKSDSSRKARMLSLTEEGIRVNDGSTPILREVQAQFFEGVSPQELAQLRRTLEKLVHDNMRIQ